MVEERHYKDGSNDESKIRLGNVPEWFLAVAAIIYVSGFLVIFTFQSMWGLQHIGLEFLRIKYLQAGFLCNLPLLTLGVPGFGLWELKRLGDKPYKRDKQDKRDKSDSVELPIHVPLLSAWMIFLFFLSDAYMFVPRARFETWVGYVVVWYLFLFLLVIGVIRSWEQKRVERAKDEESKKMAERVWWPEYALLSVSIGSILFLLGMAGRQFCLEAFLGHNRTTHSGMVVPFLMVASIGFVLLRTLRLNDHLKAAEEKHMHTHHELRFWVWTVNLPAIIAFYCLYVVSFAYNVYPYIPLERGGASFVSAKPVSITLLNHSESSAPASLFEKGVVLKPLVIVEETPTSLYVADPSDGAATKWRRGEVPSIYELRRDRVGNIFYSPPN